MTLLASTADFSFARRARSKAWLTPAKLTWLCLLGILAAVVAARTLNLIAVPECRATPVRLAFAPMTEVKVVTSARTPCLFALRLGAARVDTLTITTNPQHGVVTPRGRTGVAYRPLPGFRGEDAFWFSFDGRSNQNPGAAVVRVGVTVK